MTTGSIYFIQELPNGAVKIGWTSNAVRDRWHQIQIGNPREVVILAVIVGETRAAEYAWHERFEAVRARGEWYWPTEDLLKAIEAEASVSTESPRRKKKRPTLSVPRHKIRPDLYPRESIRA